MYYGICESGECAEIEDSHVIVLQRVRVGHARRAENAVFAY